MRADSALRDCEARSNRDVGMEVVSMMMVVFEGRSLAADRILRTALWSRCMDIEERTLLAASDE